MIVDLCPRMLNGFQALARLSCTSTILLRNFLEHSIEIVTCFTPRLTVVQLNNLWLVYLPSLTSAIRTHQEKLAATQEGIEICTDAAIRFRQMGVKKLEV